MLFPPGREKSKKLHQLIRYVINRMKLYYCRYHLICFDMENLIYFQDALPRISAFVWAAVIVLSAFLAYDVLWRRKHPQVAAGRADEAEKKACARRLSLVFCFLFVWLAVFVFFLLRLAGASVCAYWGLLPVVLGGVWLSLSLRK